VYPDKDYTDLLKELGIKMLNAVEMSSQEAAWYLLNIHMSEASRHVVYIPTTWPHKRRVRKSVKQMDEEEFEGSSCDIWQTGIVERYEKRPEKLADVSLAQFVAKYYKNRKGEYELRQVPKVIRYRNYEISELNEFKREMVLLHVPFRNEEVDLLDRNKFLAIYTEKEADILRARKEFESDMDIVKMMEYCRDMCIQEDGETLEEKNEEYVKSKATNDDFVQAMRDGNDDDIRMAVLEKMSSVVRKRENVMTAIEYCKAMRMTNMEQRDLILEAIHRTVNDGNPIQIFFTGPAGCGKTFTMRFLMETFNRFSQQHNSAFNAYVACASTGMAASAIDGTTVHSAFHISAANHETQALNSFRVAFNNVRIVFIDECSMIGSGMLQMINSRLQHILHKHDLPLAGMNMVFCGDIRQLPPVCQTPIYKRSRANFCCEIVWQSLEYYPLVRVMRQADVMFSGIHATIGDGKSLTTEERATIESRFVSREYVDMQFPEPIRLFFRTADVNTYDESIQGNDVVHYIAADVHSGCQNTQQLASARIKVNKMKPGEAGGLPWLLKLLVGRPYMIRANIDVLDGLVNGAIGTLHYTERDADANIKRLWLSFGNSKIGKLIRTKYNAHVRSNPELQQGWVPIGKRSANIQLQSKIISCKRTQFPLVEACAITIHKSQDGTYDTDIYEYDRSHDQQLVYVALSRATSLQDLYLTNRSDHTFYHARGKENEDLRNEFLRLERHILKTIGESAREYISRAGEDPTALSLCTFNTQSLKAHCEDISTDSVLPKVKIMAATETWIENNERVELDFVPSHNLNATPYEREASAF
jgi:Tfp pilus assembly pilus retraction ATPase PilT